ncbi:zinc finger protein 879-like [Uranotaenia lowii]|uniref:zinc finger protein 879-like n=1 Tax=Uranotaenia lowii TaxID=190385 RepID=UPI0024784CFB|nr:zinc finger protein 879-like [Uranotaenia lowii]
MDIVMHMARHIQPSAFKCEICGFMVTRPRFLINHRQTHLPEELKPHACPHCPKKFSWERGLHVHMNHHKPPEERVSFPCPFCNKIYNTAGGLSTHKRNYHAEQPKKKVVQVCEICAKTFAHGSALKEHVRTMHLVDQKFQLQCKVCSKWVKNARVLRVHLQTHSEIDYACEHCDYTTKKKSLLSKHIKTHHQQERPITCDTCGAAFKLRRQLLYHINMKHKNTHVRYRCNFCPSTFSCSTNFYAHRRKQHPKELEAMNEQKEQEKKINRIKAGLEPDDVLATHESSAVTTTEDGTRIITISSMPDSNMKSNQTILIEVSAEESQVQKTTTFGLQVPNANNNCGAF